MGNDTTQRQQKSCQMRQSRRGLGITTGMRYSPTLSAQSAREGTYTQTPPPYPQRKPRPSSRPSASQGIHGHNNHLFTTFLVAYNFNLQGLFYPSFNHVTDSSQVFALRSECRVATLASPSARATCTVISKTTPGTIFGKLIS